MKIFAKVILIIIASFYMVMPAQAANIVVIPIIENSGYAGIEEVYYDNVIEVIKNQSKYTMLENDAVTSAIDKYTVKGALPDEDALRNIANEVEADLIVCVKLDKVVVDEMYGGGMGVKEDRVNLTIIGNSISYNRENDKLSLRRLYENETYDPAMYVRQNYPLRKFARLMQNDMRRIMKVKGFKVEKPKLQKF